MLYAVFISHCELQLLQLESSPKSVQRHHDLRIFSLVDGSRFANSGSYLGRNFYANRLVYFRILGVCVIAVAISDIFMESRESL
ncbi:hypothetical protein A1351_09265 [Methylosinus sp. R-45379]|nr:hypothetical protein A1351_09265 [Methylosinus sp. R-45379]